MSFDSIHDNLYCTDGIYNQITISHTAANGDTYTKVIVQNNLDEPHSIVVYPSKRLVPV